ncbi:hypothetical protein BJV82DRAFT_607377 [Fennellomyces sp. T-0311]|nr:hypothetical protein BJV82DRAFT_607377 [Fennellomyces sp. T-0311]
MHSSLHTFLANHNLEQYHDAFVKAGATDQDLLQLLHFNDEELNEFLQAVNMLPFHAIKFKRGLRELRVQSSFSMYTEASSTPNAPAAAAPPSPLPMRPGLDHILNTPDHTPARFAFPEEHTQTSREVIISHATIYGKNSNRPLTSYESAINEAAVQLALDNPSLLVNKGNLFEMAKRKLLDSGYQYKRGKSRSKLTKGRSPVSHEQQQEQRNVRRNQLHAKRKLNAQRMSCERQRKIDELQNQLQAISERQRLYPGQFMSLEATRTALNKEISKIKAQERKHQWYERRKNDRSDSGFSEETTEEDPPNDDDERSVTSLSSGSSSVASSSTLATPAPIITAPSLIFSRESDARGKSFHEPTIARPEPFLSV